MFFTKTILNPFLCPFIQPIESTPRGVNYERSLLVDFSYPQSHSGVYIFSGRDESHSLVGNVVKGVFDDASYGMELLAGWPDGYGESFRV